MSSRIEDILESIINNEEYQEEPLSRIEVLLLQLKEVIESGGGGSSDAVKYTEQSLTTEQKTQARTNIGAAASTDIPTAEQQAAWSAKQNALTFDSTPTQNSINPVTSDGIYSALQNAGVQSDWSQYNSSEMDFIKNKPPLSVGHGISGTIEGGSGGTLYNYATWNNSVAYGYMANATADYALAFGQGVNAGHPYEVAFGKFNVSDTDTAFSIGDGSGSGATPNHNLMELKTNGTLLLNGSAVKTENNDESVKYTAQTLTGAQKSQARTNIGVVQPDWRQSSSSNADYIKNKPPILAVYPGTTGSYTGGTGMNSMNEATKQNSIAYGYGVSAKGDYSKAFGYFLQALHDYEISYGKYNVSNADTVFSIGDGTSNSNRHNLMELKTDGALLLNGNPVAVLVTLTGYDATKTQILKNISGTFTWVDET